MKKEGHDIELIAFAIAITAWIVLTWFVIKLPTASAPAMTLLENTTSTSTPATTTSPKNSQPRTVATPTSPRASTATVSPIVVTAPTQNENWVMQSQNTIQWNKSAGIVGSIYLMNASTGAIVGWIEQEILPNQTSFPWNTRDIFLSKTSPLKKDVAVGAYRIVVSFDALSKPAAVSGVFTIIAPSQAQVPTSTVTIQGGVFTSSSITIARGTKLIFVNHDATAYPLSISAGASAFTVATSGTYVFDTSVFALSTYVFYAPTYPALRLTVTTR